VIAGQGEKRRPRDPQFGNQRVHDIENVLHALLPRSGIIDIAEMHDRIGLKLLQRLAQQRDIVRHMCAPVADQEHLACARQPVVDDAIGQ
jgi:hypothetical protein